MNQLIPHTKFLHPTIQHAIRFIAHIFSIVLVSAALFMFGFYVIPVFGDTSLNLASFSNKQSGGELKQDLLSTPSKRVVAPAEDEAPSGVANKVHDLFMDQYTISLLGHSVKPIATENHTLRS